MAYNRLTMIGRIVVTSCEEIAASADQTIQVAGSSSDDAQGAAVAFAFMGMCTVVFALTRAAAVRRTFATSCRRVATSVDLLHRVVRLQRTRALMFVAFCVLACAAVAQLPFDPVHRVVFGLTPGLMLIVALASAWQLQRLSSVTSARDLDVSSHGRFLYVARAGRLVGWVAAPPGLVARATSLPRARLQTPR